MSSTSPTNRKAKKRDIFSAQDAGLILGLTDGRIRQEIRAGNIYAQRINNRCWAVSRREMVRYAAATDRVPMWDRVADLHHSG